MKTCIWVMILGAVGANAQNPRPALSSVENIVVIFAENRAFDVLYGAFPGANGLKRAKGSKQLDRDGSVMKQLPPVWNGLTGVGVTPPISEAKTEHLPNQPFALDSPTGFNTPASIVTRDLWHRFYQNQMQIDGGRNDRFAAWADSGAMVMAHYEAANLQLAQIAKQYVLADNFFMGAFGGSFLNHIWLICACIPKYPHADQSPAKGLIAVVEADGKTLKSAPNSPKSALDGVPKFVNDGNITPDFYAVNTMLPPYQPSSVGPAAGGDPRLSDPLNSNTLPPQTDQTIGDLLSAKGISWAWYASAWQAALSGKNSRPVPNFQYHHQPFNYFASMAPGTSERTKHLKDGELAGVGFIRAIDEGKLEQVVFYKPQGNLNEHAGYADVQSGDAHLADVVAHLQKSPQWKHMVIIITYDENGGFWDHAAPPKADRWGPGTRIPAIIVSPFAKKGFVDHKPNDTTSILRLITKRFALPVLPGIQVRDQQVKANHGRALSDLTEALDIQRF